MPVSKFLQGTLFGMCWGLVCGTGLTYAVMRDQVVESYRHCDEYVNVLLKEFAAGDAFEDTTEQVEP